MVGFPIDQFRVAPISPFFGVIGEGIEELAATTYRKWAEQGNLINIPLKQPVFFGCKLTMSRKIFIFCSKTARPKQWLNFRWFGKVPWFWGDWWNKENVRLISVIPLPGIGH